jgi:hypothetical protein
MNKTLNAQKGQSSRMGMTASPDIARMLPVQRLVFYTDFQFRACEIRSLLGSTLRVVLFSLNMQVPSAATLVKSS